MVVESYVGDTRTLGVRGVCTFHFGLRARLSQEFAFFTFWIFLLHLRGSSRTLGGTRPLSSFLGVCTMVGRKRLSRLDFFY